MRALAWLALLALGHESAAEEEPLDARLRRIQTIVAAEGLSSQLRQDVDAAVALMQGSAIAADGAGCRPLTNPEQWEKGATGPDRALNLDGLPAGARPFVCYDGREAATWKHADGDEPHPDTAVVLIENLLSPEETGTLYELANVVQDAVPDKYIDGKTKRRSWLLAGRSQPMRAPDVGLTGAKNPTPMHIWNLQEHPLVNEVEDRVARLVAIDTHAAEWPLQLQRSIANETVRAVTGGQAFHIDPSFQLPRAATVLIYLNDIHAGGHTFFPLIPFGPGSKNGPVARPKAMRQEAREWRKLVAALVDPWEHGETFEGRADPARKGAPQRMDPIISMGTTATPPEALRVSGASAGGNQRMTESCPAVSAAYKEAVANGETRGLAVQPKAGRAVVFWHKSLDGQTLLHDALHAGCDVLEGTKLSLQKFKQCPHDSECCQRSKWCRDSKMSKVL